MVMMMVVVVAMAKPTTKRRDLAKAGNNERVFIQN